MERGVHAWPPKPPNEGHPTRGRSVPRAETRTPMDHSNFLSLQRILATLNRLAYNIDIAKLRSSRVPKRVQRAAYSTRRPRRERSARSTARVAGAPSCARARERNARTRHTAMHRRLRRPRRSAGERRCALGSHVLSADRGEGAEGQRRAPLRRAPLRSQRHHAPSHVSISHVTHDLASA